MNSEKSTIKEIIQTVLIGLIISSVVLYFFRSARVCGRSMEGTLRDGDMVFVHTQVSEWNRGDICVMEAPDGSGEFYVKRIIGIGGDHILIRDGQVYLNGDVLEEEYVEEDMMSEQVQNYIVPEGCYFVMGDNRNHSFDSRSFENPYVEEDLLFAKADFRYWPLGQVKIE